ncbi:MAG: hypothetical protein AB1589_36235 [Cyanobacteriota bacterium]
MPSHSRTFGCFLPKTVAIVAVILNPTTLAFAITPQAVAVTPSYFEIAQSGSPQNSLEQGNAPLEAGDLQRRIADFTRVIEQEPNNIEARLSRARTYVLAAVVGDDEYDRALGAAI